MTLKNMFFFLVLLLSFKFKLKLRNTPKYLTGDASNTTIIGDFDDADIYELKETDDPKFFNIIVPDKDNIAMDIPYGSQELYYYSSPHNHENQKWTLYLASDGSYKILIMGNCLEYIPDKNRFLPKYCDVNKNNQFFEVEEINENYPVITNTFLNKRLFPFTVRMKMNRALRDRSFIKRVLLK